MKTILVSVASFVFSFWVFMVIGALADQIPAAPAVPPSQEEMAPKQKYRLKPEVRIEINRMDRIELYAGGLHVGSIIFDSAGYAIFVGDVSQIEGVLGELQNFLAMLSDAFQYRQDDGV